MPLRSRFQLNFLLIFLLPLTLGYNPFPIRSGRGQWKNWRKVRSALSRPKNRKKARSQRTRGPSPLIAERRRLSGGSNAPGLPAWSWKAPLSRGMQPFGSPSGGRHPTLPRPCNSPSFYLVTWKGSKPPGNRTSSCH